MIRPVADRQRPYTSRRRPLRMPVTSGPETPMRWRACRASSKATSASGSARRPTPRPPQGLDLALPARPRGDGQPRVEPQRALGRQAGGQRVADGDDEDARPVEPEPRAGCPGWRRRRRRSRHPAAATSSRRAGSRSTTTQRNPRRRTARVDDPADPARAEDDDRRAPTPPPPRRCAASVRDRRRPVRSPRASCRRRRPAHGRRRSAASRPADEPVDEPLRERAEQDRHDGRAQDEVVGPLAA